jgi:uncharacterized membrane protein YGL010W
MIIQLTNKKSALYCKNGCNNYHHNHRNRIFIGAIFSSVAIMLVLFLVLVSNNVVNSFISTLNSSYTGTIQFPYFVFIIELTRI